MFFGMNAQKTYLFTSGYTKNKKGEGVQVFEFNLENGLTTKVASIKDIINASYFELNSTGNNLYTCNDLGREQEGKVSVYDFNPKKLTFNLLQQASSKGYNPCHITLSSKDDLVAVSNYTQSSAAVFNIKSDRRLDNNPSVFKFKGNSTMKSRQEASHLHSAKFSPDDKYIYLPDLGTDQIHTLKIKKDSPLSCKNLTTNTAKSAGPRHFTFHPNGNFAYVINELSGTVVGYRFKEGKLIELGSYFSYSKKQNDYGSADIHISPDGKFLYASNRWTEENTISIFKLNQENGSLELKGHQSTYGDHPRNFVIDPSGNFLLVANRNTNNIVFFKRDQETGLLSKLDHEITMNEPTCLKFRTYN